MSKVLRALICTKDGAAVPIVSQLRQRLITRGWGVDVIAEGVSISGWEKLAVPLIEQGSFDFQVKQDTLDVDSIVRVNNPDVLIISSGSPNNLEKRMAQAARKLDIPVALLEDFWGGHVRLDGFQPNLILTLDDWGASLANQACPISAVVIVGDGAVLDEIIIPSALLQRMNELRRMHGAVYVFPTSSTLGDAALFIECMKLTPNGVAIPLVHPKTAKWDSDGMTLGERFRKMFRDSGIRVDWLDGIQRTPEQVIALATANCAGFSKTLTTSAAWRIPSVVLASDDTFESLRRQSSLIKLPHVELGVATEVREPRSLEGLEPPSESNRKKLKRYDPNIAADALRTPLLYLRR